MRFSGMERKAHFITRNNFGRSMPENRTIPSKKWGARGESVTPPDVLSYAYALKPARVSVR
jgi:hypothetical protein